MGADGHECPSSAVKCFPATGTASTAQPTLSVSRLLCALCCGPLSVFLEAPGEPYFFRDPRKGRRKDHNPWWPCLRPAGDAAQGPVGTWGSSQVEVRGTGQVCPEVITTLKVTNRVEAFHGDGIPRLTSSELSILSRPACSRHAQSVQTVRLQWAEATSPGSEPHAGPGRAASGEGG